MGLVGAGTKLTVVIASVPRGRYTGKYRGPYRTRVKFGLIGRLAAYRPLAETGKCWKIAGLHPLLDETLLCRVQSDRQKFGLTRHRVTTPWTLINIPQDNDPSGRYTDINQMTSEFVEIVPLSHCQGNCTPFAAIRWHDFGNRFRLEVSERRCEAAGGCRHQHLDTLDGDVRMSAFGGKADIQGVVTDVCL